eukprot:10020427-Alexandrium_andersonii.AAC.1
MGGPPSGRTRRISSVRRRDLPKRGGQQILPETNSSTGLEPFWGALKEDCGDAQEPAPAAAAALLRLPSA